MKRSRENAKSPYRVSFERIDSVCVSCAILIDSNYNALGPQQGCCAPPISRCIIFGLNCPHCSLDEHAAIEGSLHAWVDVEDGEDVEGVDRAPPRRFC